MLANFLGVLPILTPPLYALAFIMCSKSNPIVVFALDLAQKFLPEFLFNLLDTSGHFKFFLLLFLPIFLHFHYISWLHWNHHTTNSFTSTILPYLLFGRSPNLNQSKFYKSTVRLLGLNFLEEIQLWSLGPLYIYGLRAHLIYNATSCSFYFWVSPLFHPLGTI
jgi:hypothetical protein